MNADMQKGLAIGVALMFVMLCCGGGGSALTWMMVAGPVSGGSSGGGTTTSGGVRPEPDRPPIAVTDPVNNPPRPTPMIRPGGVSGPEWVEPEITRDQCDDLPDGGPLHENDCVTAEISCDQTIIGHTLGGVDLYDTKFYEKKFCWPATIDHDSGDERVYRLRMPPGEWRAWVTLHTPCDDLDVFGIRWDDESCPTMGSNINVCEAKPEKSTTSERIELTSQTFNGKIPIWYVVVEGKGEAEGAYSLHVQCAPGLGGPVK